MEINEMVSVRDREHFNFLFLSLNADYVFVINPADEAFAAKHMPDLGHDMKDFKVFSWRLNNWKKLDKKLTSPAFECGGHKWSGPFSMFQLRFCSLERHPSRCQQANFTLPSRKLQHTTE